MERVSNSVQGHESILLKFSSEHNVSVKNLLPQVDLVRITDSTISRIQKKEKIEAVSKLTIDGRTQTESPVVVVHPKQTNFLEKGVQTPINLMKVTFDFREQSMASINWKRIEANPQNFIGVPSLDWIDDLIEVKNYPFDRETIILVLLKARHNDTISRLALDFDKSEAEMRHRLYDGIPDAFILTSHLLDWDSFMEGDTGIPGGLSRKFGNLKSILKIIHVRVGRGHEDFKFFISILPSGQISYVSEPVLENITNKVMLKKSNFVSVFRKDNKGGSIIVEQELADVAPFLKEQMLEVYVIKELEEEDFSCERFLQRDLENFCDNAAKTVDKVMEFKIIHPCVVSDFVDFTMFVHMATIVAAMVNLQIYYEKNLKLSKQD